MATPFPEIVRRRIPIPESRFKNKWDLYLNGQVREEKEYNTALGTAQAQMFPPNSNRVSLVFVNLHASATSTIWVNDTVTTSKGIRLGAGGGKISLNFWEDPWLIEQAWHGVASGASTTFFGHATEVFR